MNEFITRKRCKYIKEVRTNLYKSAFDFGPVQNLSNFFGATRTELIFEIPSIAQETDKREPVISEV